MSPPSPNPCRRLFGILIASLGVALTPGAARAQSYNWINPLSGDWFDGNNWDLGQPPVAPAATFINFGTATITGGTAECGPLSVAGTLAVSGGSLGSGSVTVAGSLTLGGGSISNAAALRVLNTGTLSLDAGSLTTQGFVWDAGGTVNFRGGTLTVNGTGGSNFAWGGIGLQITGGTDTQNPLLVLNNVGPVYQNSVIVGFSTNGQLTLSGGTAVMGTYGFIGVNPTSTGVVTVDGAGTSWTVTSLSVGYRGNGTLNVTNGGLVQSIVGVVGAGSSGATGSTGSVTVDGAGSKWVTSSLTVGQFASGTLTVTNGGQVQCAGSGIIGDNAGATGSVTVDGAGSRLTVTNDLTVGNSGTGTLSVTGGGVLNTAALLRVSNTGSVTANGGTVCAGQLAGTGPITLTNPTGQDALIITGAAGGASYGGVIDGTGSVRKTGGGTQTFTGANLYSGGTTVAGGILFVNNTTGSGTGTGPVAVTAGGTLGGSGRIAGAVTVGSGGVVAPGDTAATTGVLTLANGITLAGGSTFAVKLNGATAGGQYDQLYVTGGAVDLGGSTLSASLGNPPGLTDNWFIIVNRGSGPVIGTFDGLPQGASFPLGSTTAYISYTGDFATGLPYGGNDVMISMQVTPVPEPGAVLGVAAAGLVLAALRRRGRTAEYTRHRRHVVDLSVTA